MSEAIKTANTEKVVEAVDSSATQEQQIELVKNESEQVETVTRRQKARNMVTRRRFVPNKVVLAAVGVAAAIAAAFITVSVVKNSEDVSTPEMETN